MRINKFLEKKIVDLTTSFDDIKCAYFYDTACSTHYIEILPELLFNDSTDLQCAQADIYDEFDEKYPNESLVFISSNSLTKIDSPSFVVTGVRYNQIKDRILWFNELQQISEDISSAAMLVVSGDNNYALAA